MSKVSSSYLMPVTSELDVKVTFSLTNLPDDDYTIEVSSMFFQDLDGLQVLLSDVDYEDQKDLLDMANEVVDAFLDDNHEKLYKELTTNVDRESMH